MIKLTITKQGEVNRIHGHEWDVMLGMLTSALSKHENPFHNNKDNKTKPPKKRGKK